MNPYLPLIAAGYLFGSIASAIVTCRLMGLPDPRSVGSGNPGATNVLRLGGKKAAGITLAGDVLKGLLPVLAGKLLGAPVTILAATAFAAFLGHLYPVFFGFRGGKGVATALGSMLGLVWGVAACALGSWLLMALAFRYSSLAALTAATLAPAFTLWLAPDPAILTAVCSISILLIWRHRANIRKLMTGTESRIGAAKKQGAN
ncbi:MAG: glycerol-3-phosphate 1-O-acyltransferase PlsY [Gammaproteobacteria bacterium]|nr:glycerol-3-phosphate 1-O-acyltransferase PlsY [Gammaproteobacteria bacterium]